MKRLVPRSGALTLVLSIASLAGCGGGSDGNAAAAQTAGQSGGAGSTLTGGSAGTTGGAAGSGGTSGGSGGTSGSSGGSGGASGAGGGSGGASGAGAAGSPNDSGTAGSGSTDARSDVASPMDVTPPVSDATVPLGIAADGIVTLMRKVADWGYAHNTSYGNPMTTAKDWSAGTFYTGFAVTWQVTKDPAYRQKIIDWGNANQWLPAGIGNPDNMTCMQTYFEMYLLEPQPGNESRYLPSKGVLDTQLAKNPTGRTWFSWEDSLYMGPAGIAMMGAITGQTSYFDKLTTMWFDCAAAYYDAPNRLWFWNQSWMPPKLTPAGHPIYWGPGNAWVLGGLVRILKYMPADYPDRPRWVALFKDMCDALRVRQQPDGMWRTSLYEPTEYPDPESSSTSFFTYAMGLGMLWGLLDQTTYMPVVQKSWPALVAVVDAQGKVGRCQPWSNAPGSACATCNTPEGQGALQLAGQAMWLLAQR
jgi:unsaturated rhamnogalacturonyl hydrolase